MACCLLDPAITLGNVEKHLWNLLASLDVCEGGDFIDIYA